MAPIALIVWTMRLSSRRSRIRAAAAAVVFALTVSTGRAGAGAAATIGIDNFGRVDSTYYRGGQPQGRHYDELKSLGVKTIVNLTSDDADPNEPMLAARAGFRYVAIPMTTHR